MDTFNFSVLTMLIASLTLTVMPAFASDYTLGIFGNANMDDTIDEEDIEYVRGIIDSTNEATELADANYDGRIDEDDINLIELIISGKEKELTVNIYTRPSMGSTDITEVPVTVHKPVERIVSSSKNHIPILRSLLKLDKDRIIGIDKNVKEADTYFPVLSKLPMVSSKDYESILSLNPDLVIVMTSDFEEPTKNLPGITVVAFDCWRPETQVDEIRRLGYILDKEDEAEEFIDFYNVLSDTIKETVDEIPEEDRPSVYFESWTPYSTGANGSGYHEKVTMAGGNNIFGDISGYPEVDPEAVMIRNPKIIVKYIMQPSKGGIYTGTDISELIDIRTEIMNRPELAEVDAVKNGKVYVVTGDVMGASRHFIGMVYMAKWFYPESFKDLDPKVIHQEYLTRFQGLPDDFLDTHDGVFVYPEPS